jgi:hypothetical protein
MNLIDKLVLPKKDSKLELYYNPNYCVIEKNVGGSLIVVNNHKEYIKDYTIEDGFMVYDYSGKNFKMPLTKLDFIMTDLITYKIKYIDFFCEERNFSDMYGNVTYNESLNFFKRDDEITLIEDYDIPTGDISYNNPRCHYHRIIAEKTILKEYSLDLITDEHGKILTNEKYYIPKIIEYFTKELNLNTLIDKIK